MFFSIVNNTSYNDYSFIKHLFYVTQVSIITISKSGCIYDRSYSFSNRINISLDEKIVNARKIGVSVYLIDQVRCSGHGVRSV